MCDTKIGFICSTSFGLNVLAGMNWRTILLGLAPERVILAVFLLVNYIFMYLAFHKINWLLMLN